MEKSNDFEIDNNLFSGQIIKSVVVIKLKPNFLFGLTDLSLKELMFDYLHNISKTESIKVLLIIGSPDKTSKKEYNDFYIKIMNQETSINELEKLYNALNQLILTIAGFNKIVIHADSGKIMPMLMNLSLACDYRIIADSTIFQNPSLEIGLMPKGGSAFFLSKMLGFSKTSEILLYTDEIKACEALKLGIVNKIVGDDKLNDTALMLAEEFAKKPARSVSGIKMLLNYCIQDLEACLEYENKLLRGMIKSSSSK